MSSIDRASANTNEIASSSNFHSRANDFRAADDWDLADLVLLCKKYGSLLVFLPLAAAFLTGLFFQFLQPEWRSEMFLSPTISVFQIGTAGAPQGTSLSEERLQAILSSDYFRKLLRDKAETHSDRDLLLAKWPNHLDDLFAVEFDRKKKLLKIILKHQDPKWIEQLSPLVKTTLVEASSVVGVQKEALSEWLSALRKEESYLNDIRSHLQGRAKQGAPLTTSELALLEKVSQSYGEQVRVIKGIESTLKGIDDSTIVSNFSPAKNHTQALGKSALAGLAVLFFVFFVCLIRKNE